MSKLTDKDFGLLKDETDIRDLSRKNKDQVNMRIENRKLEYLKTIHEDAVDIMRLLMVIAKKMGVENIDRAIEEIMGGEA